MKTRVLAGLSVQTVAVRKFTGLTQNAEIAKHEPEHSVVSHAEVVRVDELIRWLTAYHSKPAGILAADLQRACRT